MSVVKGAEEILTLRLQCSIWIRPCNGKPDGQGLQLRASKACFGYVDVFLIQLCHAHKFWNHDCEYLFILLHQKFAFNPPDENCVFAFSKVGHKLCLWEMVNERWEDTHTQSSMIYLNNGMHTKGKLDGQGLKLRASKAWLGHVDLILIQLCHTQVLASLLWIHIRTFTWKVFLSPPYVNCVFAFGKICLDEAYLHPKVKEGSRPIHEMRCLNKSMLRDK